MCTNKSKQVGWACESKTGSDLDSGIENFNYPEKKY